MDFENQLQIIWQDLYLLLLFVPFLIRVSIGIGLPLLGGSCLGLLGTGSVVVISLPGLLVGDFLGAALESPGSSWLG